MWLGPSPIRRFRDDANRVGETVRKLAYSQVALPETLDVGRCFGQIVGTRVPGIRVYEGSFET